MRMSVEEIFNFPRVDVFSAADDHVLDPADDPAVAVLVDRADVPEEINKIITRLRTSVNSGQCTFSLQCTLMLMSLKSSLQYRLPRGHDTTRVTEFITQRKWTSLLTPNEAIDRF